MEATLRTLTQVGRSRVVVVTLMEATLRTLIQRVVLVYLDGSDTQNADAGRWITVLKVDVGQGGAEAASQ